MAKLGDICNIQSGGTPSRSNPSYWVDGHIPWVKISDIKGKYLDHTEESITEDGLENSSAKVFPAGTLLYTIFATLGETCILNIDASTNQAIAGIQIKSGSILRDYLYYFLLSQKANVSAMGRGVAQNNINLKMLREFELPIPPLETQRHIAALLDKVTDLIAKRRAQLDKLDLLVKARFVEMFGDQRTNPKGWETGVIRDVVSEVKYGTSRPASEGGAYKYLRMGNITFNGHLNLTDLKYIDIPDSEIEKYIVKKGDVLFNRTNSKELVGKTCVFDLDEPMVIAGYIIRVRVNKKVLPSYLSAVLNSEYGKQTLADMCKAIVGQANINAQELQGIALLIPPIELQHAFAQFADQINKLIPFINSHIEKLETLKKALMQHYFAQ